MAGCQIWTISVAESRHLGWEQLGVGQIGLGSAGLGIETESGDAAQGLGSWGACRLFRGLAIAANVVAVSAAMTSAATSPIALGPSMEDPLGEDPLMNE